MLHRLIALSAIFVLVGALGCKEDPPATKADPSVNTTAPGAAAPSATARGTGEEAPTATTTESPVKAAVEKAAAEEKAAPKAAAVTPKVDPAKAKAEEAKRKAEERRTRIQQIYKLGRSKDANDANALRLVIQGDGATWERASALRALGREKRPEMIASLKKLTEEKAVAIKMEAAIRLYKWGETKFALPILTGLSEQGVALRRAFQTGYKDGRPEYDKNAARFFKAALKNDKQVYARLDAAVGLIELGKGKAGLGVIKSVLEKEERYHIRMAAVNYMSPLKTNEKVRALLEAATTDKDERVARRAKQILGVAVVEVKKAPALAPKPVKEKPVAAPKEGPEPGE
jgi:hypothetical protein